MAEPVRPEELVPTAPSIVEVGRVELREERAFVEKQREISGQVNIRREVERHTAVLSAELLTETLVIELRPGSSGVFIDGEALMEGETREIVTYREAAEVGKHLVVSEEVQIGKRQVTERKTFEVDLNREVLDVQQAEVIPTPREVRP